MDDSGKRQTAVKPRLSYVGQWTLQLGQSAAAGGSAGDSRGQGRFARDRVRARRKRDRDGRHEPASRGSISCGHGDANSSFRPRRSRRVP